MCRVVSAAAAGRRRPTLDISTVSRGITLGASVHSVSKRSPVAVTADSHRIPGHSSPRHGPTAVPTAPPSSCGRFFFDAHGRNKITRSSNPVVWNPRTGGTAGGGPAVPPTAFPEAEHADSSPDAPGPESRWPSVVLRQVPTDSRNTDCLPAEEASGEGEARALACLDQALGVDSPPCARRAASGELQVRLPDSINSNGRPVQVQPYCVDRPTGRPTGFRCGGD